MKKQLAAGLTALAAAALLAGCGGGTAQYADGTLKDENYGMEGGAVANRDYYNKAQKAVAACKEYAEQLVMSGNVDDIDAISGATINYNEFKEAVKKALKDAEKK